MTNVVPFRPVAHGGESPFEIVEIYRFRLAAPGELWVSLAGPRKPHGHGREPWQRIAVFPLSEHQAAVRRAQDLAAELGVPIVDLAGIMPAPDDGPEAA